MIALRRGVVRMVTSLGDVVGWLPNHGNNDMCTVGLDWEVAVRLVSFPAIAEKRDFTGSAYECKDERITNLWHVCLHQQNWLHQRFWKCIDKFHWPCLFCEVFTIWPDQSHCHCVYAVFLLILPMWTLCLVLPQCEWWRQTQEDSHWPQQIHKYSQTT